MSEASVSPRQMIERLVSFDTTSRESNLELIHFVRDYLDGYGIPSTLIGDDSGRKANLYATLGPERAGGVALSGHTDVVPVDGQDWDSDPFQVAERNGRLYGRGTSDMKSFIAIALAMVPAFQARALKVPIHFALSYDEEVGCLGVHGMLRHMEALPSRPQAVIVGEPTEMTVVNAHKGVVAVTTVVTGLEAHSSATHTGVNAIVHAAELIGFLAGLAEEMKSRPAADPRFDPPYTTIQVGTIQGGTALNIIPRQARFQWEYRALPGTDNEEILARFDAFARDDVLPRMRAVFPGADIRSEVTARVTALVPEDNSPAETLVMALVGSNQTFAVSYGTEAGHFQETGIPAVACGPGNIAQAHKPNEFIELSQVEACVGFMHRLADRLSA